ncbi:MAG: sulfur oxidation c-type cytochrome SoxA [Hyphomicrobiaceae bacterium]
MIGRTGLLLALAMAVLTVGPAQSADTTRQSATAFLSAELRAEQEDDTRNRGLLWVDRGQELWARPEGARAVSCATCHGTAGTLRGAATRYPAVDPASGTLLNLELRINRCRVTHQGAEGLAHESEALLGLTALVAYQSRGLPVTVTIDGAARPFFEAGKAFWHERQGQLNLACSQCHDDNVGRKLRGDTISSGLGTGFPAYRLEWDGLGSLGRRLRACQIGVRAASTPPASTEQLALELYLAWRARGLPLESPAVRR